jgi:hypothetical protein
METWVYVLMAVIVIAAVIYATKGRRSGGSGAGGNPRPRSEAEPREPSSEQ